MSDEHLIARLAEEAVHDTQLLMIMDYRSFESQLYHTFAQKIIDEVNVVIDSEVGIQCQTYNFRIPSAVLEDVKSKIKEHFNIREKVAVPTYMCRECNEGATWKRVTQFSGTHYFCDKHARLEEDFGQEDSSYFFWDEL